MGTLCGYCVGWFLDKGCFEDHLKLSVVNMADGLLKPSHAVSLVAESFLWADGVFPLALVNLRVCKPLSQGVVKGAESVA